MSLEAKKERTGSAGEAVAIENDYLGWKADFQCRLNSKGVFDNVFYKWLHG